MATRFMFPDKQKVELQTFTPDAVGENQVRIKTAYSLLSTGTETICFNRQFEADTGWDAWVKYPFYPGYASVGQVVEVGAKVTQLKPSDVVLCRGGHASEHVVNADTCYAVPAGVDPRIAVWFALAKIAAMGARAAQFALGERVLIIGAGPVGQMALRWANLTGPEALVSVDMVPMRLELARRGGATHTVAKPVDAAMDDIRAANGGDLPDLVIDTTGNAKVFGAALHTVRPHGRVVLLGDTGSPDQQHLTHDVVCRGVHIVGAHGVHDSPTWNGPRLAKLFLQFVQAGRFDMQGLNTHEFAPDRCAELYAFASTRRAESMGILVKW